MLLNYYWRFLQNINIWFFLSFMAFMLFWTEKYSRVQESVHYCADYLWIIFVTIAFIVIMDFEPELRYCFYSISVLI